MHYWHRLPGGAGLSKRAMIRAGPVSKRTDFTARTFYDVKICRLCGNQKPGARSQESGVRMVDELSVNSFQLSVSTSLFF